MRRQCAKCPWKKGSDPYEIPRGYSVEKHCALSRTIAEPGSIATLAGPLRIMSCHDTHDLPCVGWLAHQLGPGNNIALRLSALDGRYGEFETVGEQHERFEDTLPPQADGTLYLLHFSAPVGHAAHYVGWTKGADPQPRFAAHLAGRGSPLVRAAVRLGITVTLACHTPGTRTQERLLKRRKSTRDYCPMCSVNPRPIRFEVAR